jgi:hypothetical protein
MKHLIWATMAAFALTLGGCTKDEAEDPATTPAGPRLILKFRFDSTQVRLGNLGQPSAVPAGRGAYSPRFNKMSAHYVEFSPTALTQVGQGDVVYHAPETTMAGATAIDHDLGINVGDGQAFVNIPLSDLNPGTYQFLRVSLAYQNYDVRFYYNNVGYMGTIASFIGYNTYIGSHLVHDSTVTVNANKLQGYWAFEVQDPCLVTGAFAAPLTITGNETQDIVITVSLSTNKSFEWTELDGDNKFEPVNGEAVVDMGIRGMIPIVQ